MPLQKVSSEQPALGETEDQLVPLNIDSAAIKAFVENISDVFFFLQW